MSLPNLTPIQVDCNTLVLTLPANLTSIPDESNSVFVQLSVTMESLHHLATSSCASFNANLGGFPVQGAQAGIFELQKDWRPPRIEVDPNLAETVETTKSRALRLVKEAYAVGIARGIDMGILRTELTQCREFVHLAARIAERPYFMDPGLQHWPRLRDILDWYAATPEPKGGALNPQNATPQNGINPRQPEVQERQKGSSMKDPFWNEKDETDSSKPPPAVLKAMEQKWNAIRRSQEGDKMIDAQSSDPDVFGWLEEEGEEELIEKSTWLKYQQRGRKYLGQPKSSPRGGRPRGKNIVDQEDII